MRPACPEVASRGARRASRIRTSRRRGPARTVARVRRTVARVSVLTHAGVPATVQLHARSPLRRAVRRSALGRPSQPSLIALGRLCAALGTTATLRSARPCTRPASSALGPTSYPLGSWRPVRAPSRRSPSGQGAHLLSRFNRWRSHGRVERYAAHGVIYLDHAATTPLAPAVLEAMLPFFSERFGNASEPHWAGRAARAGLSDARARVAAVLGVAPHEVVFTGGGSESDNIAVHGRTGGPAGRIVASAIEHPAVREPAASPRRARLGGRLGAGRRGRRARSRCVRRPRAARRRAGLRDVGEQRHGRRSAGRRGRRHLCRPRRAAAPRRRAGAVRRPGRVGAASPAT